MRYSFTIVRAAAILVRKCPTNIRKFAWWSELLYQHLGGGMFTECKSIDSQWPQGFQPGVRGSSHGYRMFLDLSDWSDRRAWFFGRYYQQDLELLLEAILRPGDCFVDIGANIGMTTLIAAKCIGSDGLGLAYEPNPTAYERLSQHVVENNIDWVRCHSYGIGKQSSEAILHVGTHLGKASLLNEVQDDDTSEIIVRIKDGSCIVEDVPDDKVVIVKIDVEGFEKDVLEGISGLYDRGNVAVIVEITNERLRNVGSSATDVYAYMKSYGFVPVRFKRVRDRWSTWLHIDMDIDMQPELRKHDVLFLRDKDQVFAHRLQATMR